MNYEGRVTSVNTTTWVIELDHKLPVHFGHLAAHNFETRLPEIGEYIKIYNAHYIIGKSLNLESLFLCKKSKFKCDNCKTYSFEDSFLSLINAYNLGCSDLKAIVNNFDIIQTRINDFSQNTYEEIMWSIIQSLAHKKSNVKHEHSCLNTIIAPFKLKTISDYRFIDLDPEKSNKMPVWSFGSHSKSDQSDLLLGYLKINKRYGVILLQDLYHAVPCIITNKRNLDVYNLINRLVVIDHFHIFTELYREADVPSIEYIIFDISEVLLLDNISCKDLESLKYILVKEPPESIPYVYNFKFQLLKKGMVNVNRHGQIECWIEILIIDKNQPIYLGLNAHQVQIVPFLHVNQIYEVYHSELLANQPNIELTRLKMQDTKKFQEKMAIFVQITTINESDCILNVTEVIERIRYSTDFITFQGILHLKKLVPSLSSRTKLRNTLKEFGTPGTSTHTLVFEDENSSKLVLYLNNWENLQMPLGLVPGMRICVKNALPQSKKYLKSTAITNIEILGYEPHVLFNTINLCKDVQTCDNYTYLGWGNLIPSSVLIWACISLIHIRSLKITHKCDIDSVTCTSNSDKCINVTITFYAHDEMGAALVISKSLELLRLLLGLEPSQWKIWCVAFKVVKEYLYNDIKDSDIEDLKCKMFRDTLTITVQTINLFQMCSLELKCRKIDSNDSDENDGMPLWFCIDARRKQ